MKQVLEQLRMLDDERFLAMYESLAENGFGPLDGEVAKALKFRPQAIRKLPMQQRARKAQRILDSNTNVELAYEIFGGYLMKKSRELIPDFLDATGVEHDEGMIQDLNEAKPAPDKLGAAVEELDKKYEPADVTLYLSMCAGQWPEVSEIDALWRERSGAATG